MLSGWALRTTQRRNKDGSVVRYYALAENARHPEKGHVEARVVHSFGRAEERGEPVAERAGEIEIEAVFELGVAHVVKVLWERLGIAAAIASRVVEKELKAPHLAALLAMTMQRLERPGSKLACHERWLERVWLPEARQLSLGQLYRRPGGLRSDP